MILLVLFCSTKISENLTWKTRSTFCCSKNLLRLINLCAADFRKNPS